MCKNKLEGYLVITSPNFLNYSRLSSFLSQVTLVSFKEPSRNLKICKTLANGLGWSCSWKKPQVKNLTTLTLYNNNYCPLVQCYKDCKEVGDLCQDSQSRGHQPPPEPWHHAGGGHHFPIMLYPTYLTGRSLVCVFAFYVVKNISRFCEILVIQTVLFRHENFQFALDFCYT